VSRRALVTGKIQLIFLERLNLKTAKTKQVSLSYKIAESSKYCLVFGKIILKRPELGPTNKNFQI
jgi:hypothetical protein